ncbi:MAG: ATP-binding cassette domain-containing protein [Actinomycetota bacterium]|nr:ATP-binding cassette domain-containing protein [Actinomycetota bacterium]
MTLRPTKPGKQEPSGGGRPPSPPSAVVIDGVSFSYPGAENPSLRDVSLALPAGVFALVAGPTGAGKSTLIRTMNGLVPHFSGGSFSGRVLVSGRDTRHTRPRDLADVVGFVPQDPGAAFVVDLVEDELAYGMENLGIDPLVMRRRVEEVSDLLSLEGLRRRSVRDLSGGERQRVAIAAALVAGPRILLLDEPTSQLDPQGAEDVCAALQRLVHDLGLTVVVAEHRLERVASFADMAVGCGGEGKVVQGRPVDVVESLDLGPPVARLGARLKWHPLPLTVRDARAHVRALREPPPSPGSRTPGQTRASVTGLAAGYESGSVLTGVNLELHAGVVSALMGRNGAGKTTLLRCISGLKKPSAGRVLVDGAPPLAGQSVALCPQAPDSVLFRDRVEDEIAVTLAAAGLPDGPGPHLERLGITALVSRHPRDLSAGERLLVALASIAATGAGVLLLDEPTRGLDLEAKRKLVGMLRIYAKEGRVVLLATHDVELVAEVGERVILLASREVIADGSPEAVLGDSVVFAPQMTRVFGPGWLTVDQAAEALA